LVEAHDLVDDDVVADAHDVALAVVLDQEVDIGDAAEEPLGLNRSGPEGELTDPLPGGDIVSRRDHGYRGEGESDGPGRMAWQAKSRPRGSKQPMGRRLKRP